MIYTVAYNDKEIFGIFVETKKINCNVISNNSWTLYKNVPWSKVSRFKLRLKLKNEFLMYKKGSSSIFAQVQHKNFRT